MKLSCFQDKAGQFVKKHPQFMIKLGNRETTRLKDELLNISVKSPVYITGLARSGTTILLEILAVHPELVSFRYKDFPLVHIPYWWEKFLNRAGSTGINKVERAHKDRIKISPDSPEAMEEILWMSFDNDIHNPSINNILDEKYINDDFVEFYINNIKKVVLSRSGNRYLAKGNYNISRIKFLNKIFPDAKFVIAIRNPVDTIASLIKQHILFCEIENADKKVLKYMQTLGHFEFGLDRRPINFGNTETTREIQTLLNKKENVLGLAKLWTEVYSYVFELLKDKKLNKNIILIDYDEFCKDSLSTLNKLYMHCELDCDKSRIIEQASTISAPTYYKHDFSNEEISIIENETSTVQKKIKSIA